VLPLADPANRRVKSWLDQMNSRYQLRAWRPLIVDMAESGARPRTERYDIFEFTPVNLVNRGESGGR
jgi:hypothetical protein